MAKKARRETYRFALHFLAPNVSEGHLPGSPRVHIRLKNVTGDARGNKFVTCECVSLRELDEQIAMLRDELRLLRAEAQRRFKKHREAEERHWKWRDRRH